MMTVEAFSPLGQRDLAPVEYLAPGETRAAAPRGFRLRRRSVNFGVVRAVAPQTTNRPRRLGAARRAYYRELWQRPHPVVLEGAIARDLMRFRADIRQSLTLLKRIRASKSAVEWLARAPYVGRLQGRFEVVCTVMDPTDARELQKIYLNAVAGGRVRARDLFIKVNYLSLEDDDDSLRLRFGFGNEHFTDWRAWARQRNRSEWSMGLARAVFPESRLIVENHRLQATLARIIGGPVIFPERIIYSNTPNGGALFHHDFVPTHVGVIFAQLQGITGWLACPKHRLVEVIQQLLSAPEFPRPRGTRLKKLAADPSAIAEELESDAESPLHDLINNHPAFVGYLIRLGALRILRPGDVILLPAPSLATATWHSVFCLDDRPGLSLSFAMQRAPAKG